MPLNLHKLTSRDKRARAKVAKVKLKNEARENAAQFKRSRKANKRAKDILEIKEAQLHDFQRIALEMIRSHPHWHIFNT